MPASDFDSELLALAAVARARRTLMVNMFSGTELRFGTADKVKAGKKILRSGKKIRSRAAKLASGAGGGGAVVPLQIKQLAEEFIASCADVGNIQDMMDVITSEALSELVEEVTPFVGVALGTVKVIKAGKAVAKDGYNLYKSKEYKTGFRAGDPLAAADAVRTIIERDLAKDSINLARYSASTGSKIAAMCLDGGTASTAAIGLGNTVAGLGLELYSLGRDIKEMRAGNKRLAQPESLDLTVFNECPILGCYLLTCADTSSVANFFIADIGLPGWMDRVEEMKKKKMDPLLKIAAKDIQKSRMQLEGLSSDKGTHMQKGFFAKKKSSAMKALGFA